MWVESCIDVYTRQQAEFLLDSGAELMDPGRSPSEHHYASRVSRKDVVAVAADLADIDHMFHHIPSPKTQKQLYSSLIFLMHRYRHAPPPPSALVRYYLNMDAALHSTKAYNLLLELCIRHQMHGTAQTLIRAMNKDGLQKSTETVKLIVRSHVLAGRWEVAWTHLPWYLQGVTPGPHPFASPTIPSDGHNVTPPLSIWTEFLCHADRGSSRRDSLGQKRSRTRSHTKCDQARYLRRCAVLWRNSPFPSATSLGDLSPRVTYLVVQMLLRMGDADRALAATVDFLERSRIAPATNCSGEVDRSTHLDVIHLHLVHSQDTSISRMVALVNRLVALCPAVRPDSTTVFLLLRPLQRLRRSGSIAQSWVNKLKKEWGNQVEDRRVTRRVASLALKQGNHGLVSVALEANDTAATQELRWAQQQAVLNRTRDTPPPWVYRLKARGKGLENRRWMTIKNRAASLANEEGTGGGK